MADNLWQSDPDGLRSQPREEQSVASESKAEETFSAVPPPPPEVKIRTMRSDVAEMTKSGGGLPRFQTIKAPEIRRALGRDSGGGSASRIDWFWIVVPLLAIFLIAGIVYFAYLNFGGVEAPQAGTGGTSGVVPQSPQQPTVPTHPQFVHNSLLDKPAEEILTFISPTSAESASQLQTFGQRLLAVLSGAKASSKFLEVRMQESTGRDLAIDEVLALPDAIVLTREFLLDKFNPDPTVFAWRDGSDVWPGFIFELKASENWLFLKNDISKLEISPKIENFFLRAPGTPSESGFEDAVVSGQPARKLAYSSGASFFYGWFRGKIIFSTSEQGLVEALARL
ncbi:MAG: hypothetical protein AAB897_01265 [Patescibacteria group bacterium]